MINYRIPITNLKLSVNKIYSNAHWGVRKKIKDDVFGYVAGFCRPIQKPKSYPVEIRYRFLFRNRAFDTTNCSGMVKMFEDALRAVGILENDSPQYVARTIIEVVKITKTKTKKKTADLRQKKNEENEDYLEIQIKEI